MLYRQGHAFRAMRLFETLPARPPLTWINSESATVRRCNPDGYKLAQYPWRTISVRLALANNNHRRRHQAKDCRRDAEDAEKCNLQFASILFCVFSVLSASLRLKNGLLGSKAIEETGAASALEGVIAASAT
jgi:hypothetical protein